MINKLILKNFRGFENQEIELRPLTIIVGKNNAGKSTLIEALRLISLIVDRYKHVNYKKPKWEKLLSGISPSLDGYGFNFKSIFHNYGNAPANIEVHFNNGVQIFIYIGPDEQLHAIIHDETGKLVNSKSRALNVNIPSINTLPQIRPLQEEEEILDEDYVRRLLSSNLFSLHFRNQLLLFPEFYESFKNLSEQSWGGLKIESLDSEYKQPISLLIRDGNFVAEVSWMGHGLQMWLQTIWFLTRCSNSKTVILDEPDVYLHADLQRKLIRLLRGKFDQTIIATHSIEIISEVDPSNILILDKTRNKSSFASRLQAVQETIRQIGSIQNLQLTKLWSARKLLIIEGKDISILKHLQNVIFPQSIDPIDTIPSVQCGGWSGWNSAWGSKLLLKNAGDQTIKVYCLFDSDYHLENVINERYKSAKERDVQLHIWSKKEIENYLLIPSVIDRLILKENSESKSNIELVKTKMEEIIEELKDNTLDSISNECLLQNKQLGLKNANQRARAILKKNWGNFESKCSIVSGKQVISELSKWSKNKFNVSFNATSLAKIIEKDEIVDEMKKVLFSIEKLKDFELM